MGLTSSVSWRRKRRAPKSEHAKGPGCRACSSHGVPGHHLCWAESPRQAEEWGSFRVERSGSALPCWRCMAWGRWLLNYLGGLPVGILCDQERLSFEDVVMCSREERAQLDWAQEALYRDVVLGNFRNMVLMGFQFPKPEVICQLENWVEPQILDLPGAGPRKDPRERLPGEGGEEEIQASRIMKSKGIRGREALSAVE